MNILKAIGALSASPPPPADGESGEKAQQTQTAQQGVPLNGQEGAQANLMAQTIMRHEQIANRVHSRRR